MDKKFLKVAEVAIALGLGRSKVYELMYSGALESVKIGTCRRIPVDGLQRYIDGLRDPERAA
jgi:excisionase family DNA binding protein